MGREQFCDQQACDTLQSLFWSLVTQKGTLKAPRGPAIKSMGMCAVPELPWTGNPPRRQRSCARPAVQRADSGRSVQGKGLVLLRQDGQQGPGSELGSAISQMGSLRPVSPPRASVSSPVQGEG